MSRLAHSALDAQSDMAGLFKFGGSMSKLIKRLEQLESEIESGIRSVGKALMEIRDSKAYPHDTFEAYCKDRWGFTDRHARDLIDAEAVRVKIGSLLPVETLKTQHLVAISKIPAAKQAQVAASVIAECQAENREPTTKDYKAAAKEFVQTKADPKQEPKQEEAWEGDPDFTFENSGHGADVWQDVDDTPTKLIPVDLEKSGPDGFVAQKQAETPQALQAPIQAVATQLTGILKELNRLRDCIGGEWLDMTDLVTQINLLKDSIRQSIYWRDCMDCGGKGCKTCRQLGWLSLDRKKFLTQEQKDKVGS